MSKTSDTDNSLVISYLNLRKSVGIIGMSMPIVLSLGKIILQSPGILSSISSYYYSVMGGVFVGSLWAIGVFLFSYRGYERKDDIAGNVAGLAGIGVALFPVAPDIGATAKQLMISNWHLIFALTFFLTLAYFALFLFRKTNPNIPPTPQKKLRNIIYLICGSIMVVCIILMLVVIYLPGIQWINKIPHVFFWLEALANFAFGTSWFVKGEAILKDETK